MARKRKLDPYVSVFVDRHHKERFRFRRNGVSIYLPSPSSKEYKAEYELALAKAKGTAPITPRARPMSINDLLPRLYDSLAFKQAGYGWRKTRRAVLEAFREEFGDDLVRDFRAKDIEKIIARKLEKRIVNGRAVGGTHAALRLREQLDLLFKFAVKQEWIDENPVTKVDQVVHKPKGFYAWNEEDIARFRARWPLGTKPRLALELVLWTGARRGDAHMAAPPKNGRIGFIAGKTQKEQDLPVAPALQRAIDAMDKVGTDTLLITEYGKAFSTAGFGNWFKDKCMEAGLPQCSLHGLRAALARRAAEQGVHQQGLKALGQWSNDREAALYTESANRKRMAEQALEAVVSWEHESNIG
jgi:integrase